MAERNKLVEKYRTDNKEKKIKGDVILTKLIMRKEPQHINGYMKIFPNSKHGGREDGLGIPELSPMLLGPVKYDGIHDCLNLENFHQGNKVFPNEVDEKGCLQKSFMIHN